MEKDIATKNFTRLPDIAADIIDAFMYDGESVVKEDNLELILGDGSVTDEQRILRDRRRDVMFLDKEQGCTYVFYGIENQAGVDNTMPLRTAEYDCMSYRTQVRKYMDKNRKTENDAYAKKIHSEQKLAPVITIVLYYGEAWDGPRTLFDMIDMTGREKLRPYMSDYCMNVVELGADKELYKKFRSDFRLVVQYISIRKDKKALEEFMRNDKSGIRHAEEFLDVMSALGTDKRYEQIKANVIERSRKEEVNMCIIAEELENRGISQGVTLFATLTAYLLEDNRQEDLLRATKDEEYCKQLFEEYNLY